MLLSNNWSLFLETNLDLCFSSVRQLTKTNQHFPITRQVHTLSHSTSPWTVGAHIWTDVRRKTVPQTEWSSYATFYHITTVSHDTLNYGGLINCSRTRDQIVVGRLWKWHICCMMFACFDERSGKISKHVMRLINKKQHLNKCLSAVCCGASSWHPNLTWGAGAWHWPRQQKQWRDRPLGRSLCPPSTSRPFSRVD